MSINLSSGGPSNQQIADLFRNGFSQHYDINAPGPARPPRPQTDASELDKLLDTLAGLIEQASEQNDRAGAAEGLLELLERSGIDIQDYIEASLDVEKAFQLLKAALQGEPGGAGEQIDQQALLDKALAELQAIYAERNRRQLELDWDFMWRLIYLDERRFKHEDESSSEPLSAPAEINQGEAASALSEAAEDPVRSSRIQQHLGQSGRQSEISQRESRQALALHAAASLLLEGLRRLDADSARAQADDIVARIDEFSAWLAESHPKV